MANRSGVQNGAQFGPKYFKKWWDKACKNLGAKGVDLYGGKNTRRPRHWGIS